MCAWTHVGACMYVYMCGCMLVMYIYHVGSSTGGHHVYYLGRGVKSHLCCHRVVFVGEANRSSSRKRFGDGAVVGAGK